MSEKLGEAASKHHFEAMMELYDIQDQLLEVERRRYVTATLLSALEYLFPALRGTTEEQ